MKARTKFLFALAFLLTAANLHAAAWKLEVQGARALGSAYAGALSRDASVVWFNPAAMTLLDRTTVTAGAPVIHLSIRYREESSTTLLGQAVTGPDSPDAGTVVPVPHLYYVRPIGERARFGFGFNTPFGLGTDYGDTWVGRYHAVETRLLVYNANPSVSFDITDRLSAGAGVNLQYINATFSTMIDFGSILFAAGAPFQPQRHDGKFEIRGNDFAVGWNGGILWRPTDATMIGLSYRSHTDAEIEGRSTVTVPPEILALAPPPADARTTLPMPEAWSLDLRQEVTPRLTLLADATRTRWSRFDRLTISFDGPAQPPVVQVTDWKDVWRTSVGAEYALADGLTVRGGYAIEKTPVPDATREPRIPEADHTWYTAGATWSLSPRTDIDLFVVHLVTDRAPIRVVNPVAGAIAGRAGWNIWTIGVGATRRW